MDKSLSHTKWNCKYHIVFIPKYRRRVIYGKYRKELGRILRQLCEYKGVEIIEANACIDHIHMLILIPPKYSVAQIMGYSECGETLVFLHTFLFELKRKDNDKIKRRTTEMANHLTHLR